MWYSFLFGVSWLVPGSMSWLVRCFCVCVCCRFLFPQYVCFLKYSLCWYFTCLLHPLFLSFSIFFGCYLDIDISFVNLGGGFKHFLFSPFLGRWSYLTSMFLNWGWFNHQRPKTSLKHNPNSTCYICYPPPRQFVCAELTFHCHRNLRVPPQCYPPRK